MKVLLSVLILFSVAYASSIDEIVIDENSVGKITKDTKPEIATLKKLYPNFTYKKENHYVEDEKNKHPVIEVYDVQKKKIMTILYQGDKIITRAVHDKRIKNKTGKNIGTSFNDTYGDGSYKCFPGYEQYYEKVFCLDGKKLTYMFGSKKYHGNGELPDVNVLRTLQIQEIALMLNEMVE